MNEEHKNNISIGENQWIPSVDISSRFHSAVDIDPLILRVDDLWNALETNCVAGCCGIDAFALWPEDIEEAKTSLKVKNLLPELYSIRAEIVAMPEDVVSSNRLNNWFDKTVFLALLEHLIHNLSE
jgi:hypothetical protein